MMLTLLLLLILSSVSLQKNLNSQDGNVSSLSPDLEHEVSEIPANISVFTRFLEGSRASRHIRDADGNVDHGKLTWKWMLGSTDLPDGAVSVYNDYAKRTEYVCKSSCYSGFYSPSLDPLCHNFIQLQEETAILFQVLVNEDDFENLQWKDGHLGSVPQNSVRTCADSGNYVAKNSRGLLKVHPIEIYYRSYQVLTINKDVESNFMTDIRYHTDDAIIVSYPPETMHKSVVINYDCNQATKEVTLTKTIQEERRWDFSSSLTLGVKTEFSVGIPAIVGGKVEVSAATTFQASGGNTKTEIITHTVTVNHPVPPNHSCRVQMVGYKYKTDIPFTARFRRTYRNGKTAWTSISGKYDSVQVGEVHAVVDRCTPVPNASPCP